MFNKPSPFSRTPVTPTPQPPQLTQRTPAALRPAAPAFVDAPPANDTTASKADAKAGGAVAADVLPEALGSQLIVGPDVKLKGAEILDCDTLVVEGRVEATMDSRVIRISEKGAFEGKVGIDLAEVHGRFEGELTAREQLVIHATGRVSGVIRYGTILIEKGGVVSGDVRALADVDTSRAGVQRSSAVVVAGGA